MDLMNISIKDEPLSDGEGLRKTKTKSKKKQDLISELVSQQLQHLSTKKKRKSHNDSHVPSELFTPKKIKVEKQSEDETDVSRNKRHIDDELKNLFSKPDEQSSTSMKSLHNRHSLPKTKTPSVKKQSRNSIGTEELSRLKNSETPQTKPNRQVRANLQKQNNKSVSQREEPKVPESKRHKLSAISSTPLQKASSSKKKIPTPVPTKPDMKSSSSDESDSEGEKSKRSANNASKIQNNQDTETESSSDDEVPVQKNQKSVPKIHRPLQAGTGSKKNVAMLKADSEDGSSEDNKEPVIAKKASRRHNNKLVSRNSETDTSSENDVPAMASKTNYKQNNRRNHTKSETSSESEASVPKPRSVKLETTKRQQNAGKNNNQDSETETSSDDEVPVQKNQKSVSKIHRPLQAGTGSKKNVAMLKADSEDNREPVIAKKASRRHNNKLVSRNSETDTSSEDDVPAMASKTNYKQNNRRNHTKSETSSDSEASVPKSKSRKLETTKRQQNAGKNKVLVPSPMMVKRRTSDSEDSTSNDEQSKTLTLKPNNLTAKVKSESSSEDDEPPVPKPKNIKAERSLKTIRGKQNVPVPPPMKKEQTSDSDYAKKQTRIRKSKQSNQASESSSDQEMPVPKPKTVKTETSKTAKVKTKRVAVPAPIKRDIHSSESEESSSDNEEVSKPANKQRNQAEDLSSESSSDEEMPVPKSAKTNLRTKKVAVPAPIKRDLEDSESEESSSDSESKASNKLSTKPNKLKISRGSETDTSSDEQPPVPKPKNVKLETSKSSKQTAEKKKKSVPLPIRESKHAQPLRIANNVSRRHNTAETTSSSEEDVPVPKPHTVIKETLKSAKSTKQKISVPLPMKEEIIINRPNNITQQTQDSDRSSEDEVPQPKGVKLDHEVNTTPAQKKPFPMPIITKREEGNDSSSESDANKTVNHEAKKESTSTPESSWRERSLYQAMDWMEKLKYKFPTIEKQTVNIRLPETNAKYSLLLVPKNIDPRTLMNSKCHMNKPTAVHLNEKEYVFEPLPKKPHPVVVNANGPRLVNLQSVISLQQSLPKLTLKQLVVPKREDISLPSAIKVRHPLFGVGYKAKLSVAKHAKKKLQEAIEQKRRAEAKEKKHKLKKRKNSLRTVEESVLNIFNSIDTSRDIDLFPIKKEESVLSSIDVADGGKRKHKHKKKDKGDTMLENSLSEESYKKKKRKSSNVVEDSLEYVPKKKKKKKKHHD